ncbi:M28 family metallopeptidase [Lutibacter sp. A80]|uniref:M28 family metallopeptidase n=1 Tax=Lutibacter sp. A80 TaxID=2918453 RepID=UPI001F05E953|nr:M28 family metallopeptidase [Lutibacter sp. A80]UMB61547.1 M28 family metallopeptidase [Lutibacter sp. A80]
MKKILFLIVSSLLIVNCGSTTSISKTTVITDVTATKYAKTITTSDLKTHLYTIASDEFEGRNTGEAGHKKAANYIKNFYIKTKIATPFKGDNYFQIIPTEYLKPNLKPSENVLAFIKGSEKPEEIIVISAHLDHLGVENGEIFNGADDNGSGTVTILKIAEAFQKAKEAGNGPKRSILFLHVTGEEKGLLGSKYYVKNPVFPLENTIANLNIDMIGRIDDAHEKNPNYIYLIGSDKLSTELHNISEKINTKFTNINLDYTYNDDDDPNQFYYRSDHYNFAKNNIPIIFYFNGTHQDYHEPSDTPDKIDYELLQKRAQLIFYTTWELANRAERIKVDK